MLFRKTETVPETETVPVSAPETEPVPETVLDGQDEPMEQEQEHDGDGVGVDVGVDDLKRTVDDANPYRVTCVDARNGFNELSRKAMLWTVRHHWSKGSCFAFICY